jgi:hypothetical protein
MCQKRIATNSERLAVSRESKIPGSKSKKGMVLPMAGLIQLIGSNSEGLGG